MLAIFGRFGFGMFGLECFGLHGMLGRFGLNKRLDCLVWNVWGLQKMFDMFGLTGYGKFDCLD